MLTDLSNNFVSISMTDANTLVIASRINSSSGTVLGKSNLFYCFLPNLFNRKLNYVFDVSGNMYISGDIQVDEKLFVRDTGYIYGNWESTATSTGTLNVLGGVGISANTYIGGNTTIYGNTTIFKGNRKSTRLNSSHRCI